ncbi:MAG: type II toxin-antitoxin system VapC family toxin [Promethearchaeota archaeon]
MITIDSMIWIYNYDPYAPESKNVKSWLRGKDGVLQSQEQIVLNTIIPLEVLHSISKKPSVDFTTAYNAALGIIALKNVILADFDVRLLAESMTLLGDYRIHGIGGRDASILATMKDRNVVKIATHDKNILAIPDFYRIDPVFSPPLTLDLNESFDKEEFITLLSKI